MNLPIINETSSTDPNTVNKAFEIDLSHKKKLEKALNLTKFDCYPILWVISNPSQIMWDIVFK